MPNLPLDLISGVIGFALTLMVLSYLIGDNPLFRFATYLFVGVSAGYVAVMAWHQVIVPNLFQAWVNSTWPARGLLFIPIFLFVLMLMKISPRLSWLGGPAIGYVAGVGAAVAVGGAILGTLLPQIPASAEPFDARAPNAIESMFTGLVLLVGTITSLAYFHFGARRKLDGSVRRNALVNMAAWAGQLFVAIALGVLFAGVYSAALTVLIERIAALAGLFFG